MLAIKLICIIAIFFTMHPTILSLSLTYSWLIYSISNSYHHILPWFYLYYCFPFSVHFFLHKSSNATYSSRSNKNIGSPDMTSCSAQSNFSSFKLSYLLFCNFCNNHVCLISYQYKFPKGLMYYRFILIFSEYIIYWAFHKHMDYLIVREHTEYNSCKSNYIKDYLGIFIISKIKDAGRRHGSAD